MINLISHLIYQHQWTEVQVNQSGQYPYLLNIKYALVGFFIPLLLTIFHLVELVCPTPKIPCSKSYLGIPLIYKHTQYLLSFLCFEITWWGSQTQASAFLESGRALMFSSID